MIVKKRGDAFFMVMKRRFRIWQEALMRTYEEETDPRMKYNMLLEFSSYLRQVMDRANAITHS